MATRKGTVISVSANKVLGKETTSSDIRIRDSESGNYINAHNVAGPMDLGAVVIFDLVSGEAKNVRRA